QGLVERIARSDPKEHSKDVNRKDHDRASCCDPVAASRLSGLGGSEGLGGPVGAGIRPGRARSRFHCNRHTGPPCHLHGGSVRAGGKEQEEFKPTLVAMKWVTLLVRRMSEGYFPTGRRVGRCARLTCAPAHTGCLLC